MKKTSTQGSISLKEIASEWDSMVLERAYEIEHGLDQTHENVIVPTICAMTKKFGRDNIIDVGCGLGFVTQEIHLLGYEITGIDVSLESINFASNKFTDIRFSNISIAEYSKTNNVYSTCIANMVFHNSPNLQNDLFEIHSLLERDGYLLLSIPHPAFWYASRSHVNWLDFDYEKERTLKLPFKIRNGKTHKSLFTYFHRTISTYVNSLAVAGFSIEEVIEPYDDNTVVKTDLLFIACKKLPNKACT